jgi:hypothetical protein
MNSLDYSHNLPRRLSQGGPTITATIRALTAALLVAGILLAVSCSSKQEAREVDTSSLLPGDSQITGFSKIDSAATYDRSTLFSLLGPSADLYLYNGFQNLRWQRYAADSGSGNITIELFQISNPRNCFALYSQERKPQYQQVQVGAEGWLHGDTLVFMKSKYIVKLIGSSPNEGSALEAAASIVADKIKGNEPLPEELALFPKAGMIPNSTRLTMKDFLGESGLSDVFSASYLEGADTVTFSFRLGSDNNITDVIRHYIGDNGSITGLDINAGYQVLTGHTPEVGNLLTTVRDGVLCFVTGFTDKKSAEELISDFFRTYKSSSQREADRS